MIYLLRDNQQVGPYESDTIREMLSVGQAQLDELAWKEGLEDWRPLREILDAGEKPITSPQSNPTSHQSRFPRWFIVGMATAIVLFGLGLYPSIKKAGRSLGVAASLLPPDELLDSKFYGSLDGSPVPLTNSVIREIVARLEKRSSNITWSHEADESWILHVSRDDPLTDKQLQLKLQLILRSGKTLVVRASQNNRVLTAGELSFVIPIISGDLEKSLNAN